jgi:cysteine desulfurase/selenocysteine lyase
MSIATASRHAARFDVEAIRDQFPALAQQVHGRPLVYLDNAATSQKPKAVIEALEHYYRADNANVHRGLHALSERATEGYEGARRKVADLLHAGDPHQIVFVRGCTEAINLVASSYGGSVLSAGDEVLITHMEHHSNIVPWQLICQRTGAKLKVAPIDDRGQLDLEEFANRLSKKTKIVAAVHVSNALGTINPVKRMIELAHGVGAKVLIDGAQAVCHMPVDVRDLDADFYVVSGHKMFGPTGIGALYGKADLLASMPPYQGGGEMIQSVRFEQTTYAEPPARFEAGTPHIAGAIGLGAAVDWLQSLDFDAVQAHEQDLLDHGTQRLAAVPGLTLIGDAEHKASVLSFVIDGVHPYDLGMLLDREGIAVRTGHHCTQPLMERFGVSATTRASLALYNTRAELDQLADALTRIVEKQAEAGPAAGPAPSDAPADADADAPVDFDELAWPEAKAETPEAAAAELLELFSFFDDWEQRYQHIIDMGEKLPPMPDAAKTEQTRVHGCQSIVHLIARQPPDRPEAVQFIADSDAALVRGLIAVLQHVFSGQPAERIVQFDVAGFLRDLGFERHLTMGRRNGLQSMIQRIRRFAAEQIG